MAETMLERGAGVLMPVSSLPSPYGIGTFGKAAFDFIDALVRAKQKYWQVLPMGPTGYGDSPYAPYSAFAGNPYFIDLEPYFYDKSRQVMDTSFSIDGLHPDVRGKMLMGEIINQHKDVFRK